ncbi:hypothetical protein BH11PLA2_BH11PLA2_10940 [soil metagenome]
MRALVKRPPLLVLDEPYQGLDAATIVRLNAWFDSQLTPQQTLIVTTHRREELPACVTLVKDLRSDEPPRRQG